MNQASAFKPLTKDDIAGVLGVSSRTIEHWVNDGTLPAPRRLGNRVYWHPGVFYGWLEHRLVADEPGELAQPSAAIPAAPTEPVRAPVHRGAMPVKTEVERLRRRDQAKLDALIG